VIFWIGYFSVFAVTFIKLKFSFGKIQLGHESFQMKTDYLLHFAVYLLICLYFLFGQLAGFSLFKEHSFRKFVVLIVFLASITEVVQVWVPARSFNEFDWISNLTGFLTGILIIHIRDRLSRRLPGSNKVLN